MITKGILLAVLLGILLTAGSASADFMTVSTSFGALTALRDNHTQLDWLHLNLTKSISYTAMKVDLLPGGIFYGWRYATPEELKQMFVDYDGSPDGVVRFNDALAIQFMQDLGGPTWIADDFSTGFHREDIMARLDVPFALGHAIYGYIAIDNVSGATITPALQGSSVDWFADFTAGHWLVQQEASQSVPEPASILLLANGLLVGFGMVKRKKA